MTPATAIPSTREALIEAATELLQEVGWTDLHMRDLAARVGIRAPSIHHHFPTKVDLGLAIINHMRRERETKANDLVRAHVDVRARLIALGDLVAECQVEGERSCPIYAFQAAFAVLSQPMQEALAAWIEDMIRDLASWLDDGRTVGHLNFRGDARSQALVTWSVLQQGTQLHRTHPQTDFPALVRHFVASIST